MRKKIRIGLLTNLNCRSLNNPIINLCHMKVFIKKKKKSVKLLNSNKRLGKTDPALRKKIFTILKKKKYYKNTIIMYASLLCAKEKKKLKSSV